MFPKHIFALFVGVIVCVKSELSYNVTEETKPYSFQANLVADSGIHEKHSQESRDKLRFSYFSGDEIIRQYFDVDSTTSILFLKEKIDREVLCPNLQVCTFQFNVIVQPPEYSDLIKVKFTIIDVNDNSPVYEQEECKLEISEGAFISYSIPLPLAEDLDSPPFSVIDYNIVSSDGKKLPFRLSQNRRRGSISAVNLILQERLDREKTEQYSFTYTATDGGLPTKSGSKNCEVIVKDINDNTPIFDNSTYYISIGEDVTVGNTILHVHAKDADAGLNGVVQYAITPDVGNTNTQFFGVNPTSGAVFVRSALDAKSGKDHQLVITASDNGEESLSSTAEIIITVTDVNNHAPQIHITSFSTNKNTMVSEELEPGAFVGQVTIIDGDIGQNAKATCTLNDTLNFKLIESGENEYKLETNVKLDREIRDNYDVLITCHDLGVQPKVSSKVVKIFVSDTNDHPPYFIDGPYSTIIKENTRMRNPVLSIRAHDLDFGTNAQITYEIISGNDEDYFNIHTYSGDLFLLKGLDFEKHKSHTLLIRANDSARSPRFNMTSAVIDVEDLNDNPARFNGLQYHLNVAENEHIGSSVGFVDAYDIDYEPYNGFTYSIVNIEDADLNLFEIGETSGLISTSASFNREERDVYYLEVATTNIMPPMQTDKTVVVVSITDKNDHKPVFDFPSASNNTIYVSDTVEFGKTIAWITATDLDKGNNSLLSFYITDGNDNELFHLDEHSGELRVADNLKRFTDTLFTLSLLVKDNGVPSFSSEKNLHIGVNSSFLPVNKVSQNALIGTSIAVIISCIIMVAFVAVIFLILLYRRNRLPSCGNCGNCIVRPPSNKRRCTGAEIAIERQESCSINYESRIGTPVKSSIADSPARRSQYRSNRYGVINFYRFLTSKLLLLRK